MRYASADVRKQFFIDMFTRDISLEDCVLDLIDNSIDSYLLKRDTSISKLIFGPDANGSKRDLGKIDMTCNERQIIVVDRRGGVTKREGVVGMFDVGDGPQGQ